MSPSTSFASPSLPISNAGSPKGGGGVPNPTNSGTTTTAAPSCLYTGKIVFVPLTSVEICEKLPEKLTSRLSVAKLEDALPAKIGAEVMGKTLELLDDEEELEDVGVGVGEKYDVEEGAVLRGTEGGSARLPFIGGGLFWSGNGGGFEDEELD